MTQIVKTEDGETLEDIRGRIEEVTGRKIPDFWKSKFAEKKLGPPPARGGDERESEDGDS